MICTQLPKCGREIIQSNRSILKKEQIIVQISPTLNYFAEFLFNLNHVLKHADLYRSNVFFQPFFVVAKTPP